MNTIDKRNQYMEQPPTSNEMWLAQVMLGEFTDEEINNLRQLLTKLDSAMFKSWAKEMTFQQLMYSINIVKALVG